MEINFNNFICLKGGYVPRLKKTNLLIIGGGYMGSLLAKYFCPYLNVTVYETNEERCNALIENPDFEGINFTTYLDCIEVPNYVIEAVPEKLEIKQLVFQKVQQTFGNHPIYCTNTSSILISKIAEGLLYPERLVGTHFFSPADISPLVEVIPNKWTDEAVINEIMEFLIAVKKKPVRLKREIEGFVANRLQSALAREAMSLVEKGIVTAEELDFIAKWSLGIRLALTGPIEQRDINGLDTHLSIVELVYPTLENSTKPLKILQEKVEKNELGVKTNKGFYEWNGATHKYLNEKSEKLKQIIEIVREVEGR